MPTKHIYSQLKKKNVVFGRRENKRTTLQKKEKKERNRNGMPAKHIYSYLKKIGKQITI